MGEISNSVFCCNLVGSSAIKKTLFFYGEQLRLLYFIGSPIKVNVQDLCLVSLCKLRSFSGLSFIDIIMVSIYMRKGVVRGMSCVFLSVDFAFEIHVILKLTLYT